MAEETSRIGTEAAVSSVVAATAEIDTASHPTEIGMVETMIQNLHRLQIKDIEQQLEYRPKVIQFTAKLIVWQYIVVAILVWFALLTDKMKDLGIVFGTLVGGTLLQTAYVAKVMVRFLFKDIDYHDKEYNKWF